MANVGAWWNSLTPATQQALMLTASQTGAAAIDAAAENKRAEYDRQASAITNQAEGIQSLIGADANDYQFKQNRDNRAHEQAAQMAGSDPGEFQRKRMGHAAQLNFLQGSGSHNLAPLLPNHIARTMPSGGHAEAMTPFTSALNFGPTAEMEEDFYRARGNVDPSLKSPNLGAIYGETGDKVTNSLESDRLQRKTLRDSEDAAYKTAADARKEALQASLGRLDSGEGGGEKKDDGGGIDWKKWGTLAAMGGAGAYLGSR